MKQVLVIVPGRFKNICFNFNQTNPFFLNKYFNKRISLFLSERKIRAGKLMYKCKIKNNLQIRINIDKKVVKEFQANAKHVKSHLLEAPSYFGIREIQLDGWLVEILRLSEKLYRNNCAIIHHRTIVFVQQLTWPKILPWISRLLSINFKDLCRTKQFLGLWRQKRGQNPREQILQFSI